MVLKKYKKKGGRTGCKASPLPRENIPLSVEVDSAVHSRVAFGFGFGRVTCDGPRLIAVRNKFSSHFLASDLFFCMEIVERATTRSICALNH